jgi:hypothetical protein
MCCLFLSATGCCSATGSQSDYHCRSRSLPLTDVLLVPVSDELLLSDGLTVGLPLPLTLALLLTDVLPVPVSDGLLLSDQGMRAYVFCDLCVIAIGVYGLM